MSIFFGIVLAVGLLFLFALIFMPEKPKTFDEVIDENNIARIKAMDKKEKEEQLKKYLEDLEK